MCLTLNVSHSQCVSLKMCLFYRLRDVLRDHDGLTKCGRVTLRDSFRSARLHLWDEATQQLVPFAHARKTTA